MLRNFGLTLFLATVAINSGQAFVTTVAIVLLVGLYVLRIPFDDLLGVASGATSNPAILVEATRMAPTERPDIGYAMIFPSATIVKVIAAQVVGLLAFGHFDLGLWIGIFVPRATPRDVVLRLNRALNELLAQPDLSEQVKREGGEIAPMAPEQFASFVRSESARYADLLQEEFCSRLLLGGCLGFGFAD